MEDLRSQLGAALDAVCAGGKTPTVLVAVLEGAAEIKAAAGREASLASFHHEVIDALCHTGGATAAFVVDDECIVAVLPGFARLYTFARIDKLRHAVPMISQSFDCTIMPSFDVLEYDETGGLAEIMRQLADRKRQERKTA